MILSKKLFDFKKRFTNFNQPLDDWDVSSVTDMSEIFEYCEINDENKPKFTKMDEDD